MRDIISAILEGHLDEIYGVVFLNSIYYHVRNEEAL